MIVLFREEKPKNGNLTFLTIEEDFINDNDGKRREYYNLLLNNISVLRIFKETGEIMFVSMGDRDSEKLDRNGVSIMNHYVKSDEHEYGKIHIGNTLRLYQDKRSEMMTMINKNLTK